MLLKYSWSSTSLGVISSVFLFFPCTSTYICFCIVVCIVFAIDVSSDCLAKTFQFSFGWWSSDDACVSICISFVFLLLQMIIWMIPPPLCSSNPLQMVVCKEDGRPDDQYEGDGGARIVANDHPDDPASSVLLLSFAIGPLQRGRSSWQPKSRGRRSTDYCKWSSGWSGLLRAPPFLCKCLLLNGCLQRGEILHSFLGHFCNMWHWF